MKLLNQHEGKFRLALFAASLVPISLLAWAYKTENLGINPFAELIETTGFWAIVYLLLALAVTPLRRWLTWGAVFFKLGYGKRLSDWNFLIKSRRQLGLWSFFYLNVHVFIYLHFELDWWLEDFYLDVKERNFILLGLVSWFVVALLAITSPDAVRKAMGKRWRQLHRLMYLASVLAVMHIYFEAKPNEYSPYWYVGIACVLLMHRILVHTFRSLRRRDDTGMPSYR